MEWTAGRLDCLRQRLDNNVLDVNEWRVPSSAVDATIEEINASIGTAGPCRSGCSLLVNTTSGHEKLTNDLPTALLQPHLPEASRIRPPLPPPE